MSMPAALFTMAIFGPIIVPNSDETAPMIYKHERESGDNHDRPELMVVVGTGHDDRNNRQNTGGQHACQARGKDQR